jgi:hypothetical protein
MNISVKAKLNAVKHIILNRKSAFNYQEWQELNKHLKLDGYQKIKQEREKTKKM